MNFTKGRSGYQVEGIVIHSMVGTQAGSIAWFKNPKAQASAHYCVSKDGEVVQTVLDEDFAWHAGNVTTPYAELPFVIKDNWDAGVKNPNFYTIGIELEDNGDVHWNYPQKQMDALVELIKTLSKKFNIPLKRSYIVAHREVDKKNKSDPIGNFSFEKLMIALGDTPTANCAEWQKKAEYEEGEKEKYKKEAREGRVIINKQAEDLEKLNKKYSDLVQLYQQVLAAGQTPTTPPNVSAEDLASLVKMNSDLSNEVTRINGELKKVLEYLDSAKMNVNVLSVEVTRLKSQKFSTLEALAFLINSLKGVSEK